MKKKTTPPAPGPTAPAAPTVLVVDDLSALEKLCLEPLACECEYRGRKLRFEGRRLTPAESSQIKLLLEGALPPPLQAGREGGEPQYDLQDAEYRGRLENSRRKARAVGLWLGFPQFKRLAEKECGAAGAGKMPENGDEILRFVETRQLDDDILDVLFQALTIQLVEQQALVGFTSGSSSPKS
jgi:hypothetical protein